MKKKLWQFAVIAFLIGCVTMMCFEKTCLLGALLLIAFYIWCKGGIKALLKEWEAEMRYEEEQFQEEGVQQHIEKE